MAEIMERAVQTLNRLLEAEYGSIVHRLAEADPFVTSAAADDQAAVRPMIAELNRHQRELTAMILKLRGAPVPPRYPTALGGVNYLSLTFLMPQVIAGTAKLVQTYQREGTTGHPESDELIGRILQDHKRHLEELKAMHSNLAPSP